MSDTFLLEHGFQFSAALDPHRRSAFIRALEQAFDAHDENPSVALLGWQAATLIDVVAPRAGRVVIIEKDATLVETIRNGLLASGTGKQVTILNDDPADASLREKVDIVVCGHSSTWFIEGPGAAIVTNARNALGKPDATMIPRRFVHMLELVSAPTDIQGISLRAPRYGRPGEPFPVLSESKHFITTDLTEPDPRTELEDSIIIKPLLSGTLTGLKLTTLTELGDNNVYLAGHSGFQSIFTPLREDVEVRAGEPVTVFLKVAMGEGLQNARFMARNVEPEAPATVPDEVIQRFTKNCHAMVDSIDELGRGQDLDKVVTYTIDPHGDVSRLTALFWTIDEEFRKPVRELVESFKLDAAKHGATPADEVIYDLMIQAYNEKRG